MNPADEVELRLAEAIKVCDFDKFGITHDNMLFGRESRRPTLP